MEKSRQESLRKRGKRTFRVRNRLRRDTTRPRLCVVKTNKHIHVQVVDDSQARTIAAASTLSMKLKKNKTSAKQLGQKIAESLKSQNVEAVVFDRGPFSYHGLLAAVADGARESGLQL